MRITSNSVKDFIKFLKEELEDQYYPQELDFVIREMFYHVFNWDLTDYTKNLDSYINESDLLILNKLTKRLKTGEPLQYVLGYTWFYDYKIKLNKNVLIPRPETEELVDIIINDIDNNKHKILDIGCGSGAISITIAKEKALCSIEAIDISKEALELAEENAKENNIDSNINFIKCDILSDDINLSEYDIIISNPPYVLNKEKEMMHNKVLEYEPHLALFVDNNEPLIFYDKIIYHCQNHLKSKGKLYFEINEAYAQAISSLLKSNNFTDINIIKDLKGKDRFISAIKL